jgi:alpha-1,2-mannosyltransferase
MLLFRTARVLLGESDTFSFSLTTAFRLFFIVNIFSALYRIPTDYDEIYNYWEPTHFLLEGYGRETWEYSLDYKTKSWAFIFVNSIVGFISKIFVSTKVKWTKMDA